MIKKQTTTARGIWCNLLSRQNEAISLVAMRSKELWLVQEYHATVKLDSNGFSWNENLQRKQNSNPQIVRKILEKSSQILSAEQPWILQELKEHARKTCGCVQYWRPFDSSFEWKDRSVCDGATCVLFGWWFSNYFDIDSETPYSEDTVGR